jgi:hypothetical protein
MSKIKIVQIALTATCDVSGDRIETAEYLDDEGRVWYQDGHWENYDNETDHKWVVEWKQVELPDESLTPTEGEER